MPYMPDACCRGPSQLVLVYDVSTPYGVQSQQLASALCQGMICCLHVCNIGEDKRKHLFGNVRLLVI